MAFKGSASLTSSVDAMGNSTVDYVVATDALQTEGNLLTMLGRYDKNRFGARRGSVGSLGVYK